MTTLQVWLGPGERWATQSPEMVRPTIEWLKKPIQMRIPPKQAKPSQNDDKSGLKPGLRP